MMKEYPLQPYAMHVLFRGLRYLSHQFTRACKRVVRHRKAPLPSPPPSAPVVPENRPVQVVRSPTEALDLAITELNKSAALMMAQLARIEQKVDRLPDHID